MPSKSQVVKAMVVIRRERDGALLVSAYSGPEAGPFHRPLGGHVEFGEYADRTVRRELVEEIGQQITDVQPLGVLENIFRWQGSLEHEIVFVFRARFADPAAYEISEQRIRDAADEWTTVIWRPAGAHSPPFYPDGIQGLADQAEA